MPMTIQGWSFKSDLSLREMMQKLNAVWWDPWEEGDGEHGDYIAGQLTKEAVARIYKAGHHYVVNLRFFSRNADAQAQLQEARETLLTKVLPLIGARDVQRSEPHE